MSGARAHPIFSHVFLADFNNVCIPVALLYIRTVHFNARALTPTEEFTFGLRI